MHHNAGCDRHKNTAEQAEGCYRLTDYAALLGQCGDPLALLVIPVDLVEGNKQTQQQLGDGAVLLGAGGPVQIFGSAADPNQIPDAKGKGKQQDMLDETAVSKALGTNGICPIPVVIRCGFIRGKIRISFLFISGRPVLSVIFFPAETGAASWVR